VGGRQSASSRTTASGDGDGDLAIDGHDEFLHQCRRGIQLHHHERVHHLGIAVLQIEKALHVHDGWEVDPLSVVTEHGTRDGMSTRRAGHRRGLPCASSSLDPADFGGRVGIVWTGRVLEPCQRVADQSRHMHL